MKALQKSCFDGFERGLQKDFCAPCQEKKEAVKTVFDKKYQRVKNSNFQIVSEFDSKNNSENLS